MKWLSNDTLAHLREMTETPDFSSTRYTIVRELARGGMGIVYEAEDRNLGRHVALKVLPLEAEVTDAAPRLTAEARTIAQLEHPGIVPVHDSGTLPDGRTWYTMKLVQGETLREYAAREHSSPDLLRVFLRVCEAISFAHAHGFVHHDLKPDNVMVGKFGEVFVMDWGLARPRSETTPGEIAGTRGFMAPEQERGDPVDARADVYALGVILSSLTAASRPLRAIAAKAANPQPGERYADASALSADLLRYLDGEPVAAYREGIFETAARLIKRHRALVALVVAYLVMRAIILLWGRV